MEPVAIQARALTKRFGKVTALDALDLEVPAGRAVGLVGPSGAGKSTFVRILAGLVHPTSGSAGLNGINLASRRGISARDALGVVHQSPRFPDSMTAGELLGLIAELAKVPVDAIEARVADALESAGVAHLAGRRIRGCTDGERRRLGWAQAFVAQPSIVVLDDPFAGLDPEGEAVLRLLVGSARERGGTVLLATRRPSDLVGFDAVVGLEAGRASAPVERAGTGVEAAAARTVYLVEVDPGMGLALAGLVAHLRAEAWVTDATAAGGQLRVEVADDVRAARELLPAITASGLPVVSYRRTGP